MLRSATRGAIKASFSPLLLGARDGFLTDRGPVEFRRAGNRFCKRSLNEGFSARERDGEFNFEGWKKCAQFGLHGLAMPEKYGGLAKDILTCVTVMEGLGYACRDSGLLFAINSTIWTCEYPILKFGTDAQKEKYLSRVDRWIIDRWTRSDRARRRLGYLVQHEVQS